MTETILFSMGTALTVIASWIAVLYLREQLHIILTDLCGIESRARFWTAFTTINLMLVPLIFALAYRPEPKDAASLAYLLGAQLHDALFGLFVALLVVGVILSLFIVRTRPGAASASANRAA